MDIPIYRSSLPEAKLLADLESLSNDLRLVTDIVGKLISGENDTTTIRALFSAALITYRRCFTSGVRIGLTRSDVSAIPNNAVGLHDYLYAQAGKLIAHSVNPFEHTQAGILVRDGGVFGVATLSAQLMNFDKSQLDKWHRLTVVIMQTILNPRIEAARTTFAEAAKALSIAKITEAPILEYQPATAAQADKKRL